jgi:hypothetical protein
VSSGDDLLDEGKRLLAETTDLRRKINRHLCIGSLILAILICLIVGGAPPLAFFLAAIAAATFVRLCHCVMRLDDSIVMLEAAVLMLERGGTDAEAPIRSA